MTGKTSVTFRSGHKESRLRAWLIRVFWLRIDRYPSPPLPELTAARPSRAIERSGS